MSQTASRRIGFFFLNLGHGYDHLFMMLYPTVVLGLEIQFDRPYSEMLTLSLPGFIAFAAGTLPAGWLGNRWSRSGMIAVFFLGIGASSIVTSFAHTPVEIAGGLTLIGLFASIYHPVAILMMVDGREKVGKVLGINGVYGNLGFAIAPLAAAGLMQVIDWQAAFLLPGIAATVTGFAYVIYLRVTPATERPTARAKRAATAAAAAETGGAARPVIDKLVMRRVFGVVGVMTESGV
ncbi:MAG: MFS transporter [Proteobacteria bacterium]|nr:MFS transporter [Pseudomonadota bacterium]MDA1357675.1 MFS transporter [Pseudomonadota bacterium]